MKQAWMHWCSGIPLRICSQITGTCATDADVGVALMPLRAHKQHQEGHIKTRLETHQVLTAAVDKAFPASAAAVHAVPTKDIAAQQAIADQLAAELIAEEEAETASQRAPRRKKSRSKHGKQAQAATRSAPGDSLEAGVDAEVPAEADHHQSDQRSAGVAVGNAMQAAAHPHFPAAKEAHGHAPGSSNTTGESGRSYQHQFEPGAPPALHPQEFERSCQHDEQAAAGLSNLHPALPAEGLAGPSWASPSSVPAQDAEGESSTAEPRSDHIASSSAVAAALQPDLATAGDAASGLAGAAPLPPASKYAVVSADKPRQPRLTSALRPSQHLSLPLLVASQVQHQRRLRSLAMACCCVMPSHRSKAAQRWCSKSDREHKACRLATAPSSSSSLHTWML